MSTKIFMLFASLVFWAPMFSQNSRATIEVIYESKIISDSLNRDQVSIAEFTLLCNTSESLYFTREAKNFYDVLAGKKKKENSGVIMTSAGAIPKYPKYNGSVYKNNDKLTVALPVGKYIFKFEEPKLKWEILKETKEIKDFKCQLAKTITDTGDTFYAWFTSDIPITEGPFRFKGLSGLILEVYNKNKTIEISATEIKKSEEIIESISYLESVNAKSKSQYLEARNNYIQNPSVYNGNMRIFDASGNERTKGISERLKKINVFLN